MSTQEVGGDGKALQAGPDVWPARSSRRHFWNVSGGGGGWLSSTGNGGRWHLTGIAHPDNRNRLQSISSQLRDFRIEVIDSYLISPGVFECLSLRGFLFALLRFNFPGVMEPD